MLKLHRVIVHHAKPEDVEKITKLIFSIPHRGQCSREAFAKRATFLAESDFLDDPSRPGVVFYPWAIAADIRASG